MNFGMLIIMIIGGAVGILSSLYIIISLPVAIGQKVYRKVRHGKSLYD